MTTRRFLSSGLTLLVYAGPALAGDEPAPQRPPMPEPIYTETVTDLDGREPGELEVELNATEVRPLRGPAGLWQTSVEVELLATRHLGLRLEPILAHETDPGGSSSTNGSLSGGFSWKLVQDFERDFHLQAEVAGRIPTDSGPNDPIQPGDAYLPAAFDLRAGLRLDWLTLRAAAGAEAGGSAVHAPVRASIAAFTGFGATEKYGFWGVELDADGARTTPVALALNLCPSLYPLGLPFRFAIAVPWAVGADDTRPSLGLLFRLFIESEREAAYGRRPEEGR